MKTIIFMLTISLLFITSQGDGNQVSPNKVYSRHEYTYEYDSQENFFQIYPGSIQGILKVTVTQVDFKSPEDQKQQKIDGFCEVTTEKLSLTNSKQKTVEELVEFKDESNIIAFTYFPNQQNNTIYILTNKKVVIEVVIFQETMEYKNKSGFYDIIKNQIDNQTHIVSNKMSNRIFVIGNSFILSFNINNYEWNNEYQSMEKGLNKCSQVNHVLSVHNHLVLSCLKDGLNVYQVNKDGFLFFKKTYHQKHNVYQSEFSSKYQTLAYLHDDGISFIKFDEELGFDRKVDPFYITNYNGRFFSQYEFQTFWIKNENEYSITEIFVDYSNQSYENNGGKYSNKVIKVTKMIDMFGLVVNENNLNIYIHSIPQDITLDFKEKIGILQIYNIN